MTDEDLRELVDHYQPNQEALSGMADIRVLGTVGPSASGKTTLMNALVKIKPAVKFILDETSRTPRPNEVNGVDFLFRTKDEILQDLKSSRLVQVAIGPNGDLYATRLSSYPVNTTGVIALVPAAVREFRKLPIKFFEAAFIVPATYEKWRNWLAKQAEVGKWTSDKLEARLAEAKKSYEFALSDKDIHFVLNDDISRAVERLIQILNGQPPADEELARTVAEKNFRELIKSL